MQLGDGFGGEVEPGDQVVVVVRDREELQPAVPSHSGKVEDAVCAEGDVLGQSGALQDGRGDVQRHPDRDPFEVRISWLRTSPVGPATSTATEASSPSTLVQNRTASSSA